MAVLGFGPNFGRTVLSQTMISLSVRDMRFVVLTDLGMLVGKAATVTSPLKRMQAREEASIIEI